MKVAIAGGGPAGLYAALLIQKDHPGWDVTLFEKNPAGATYGWGVVFSDRTLSSFREADQPSYESITDAFVLWEAIEIVYRGEAVRCEGQAFSGIARKALLGLLQARCGELGVDLRFESEVAPRDLVADHDLVVAADGVHSMFRSEYEADLEPSLSPGRSRYIWFGTDCPLGCFTFAFRETENGLFQAHAYPFDGEMSTFIVECSEETWRRAGLDATPIAAGIAFCEDLFNEVLGGHGLRSNNSKWINFVTLRTRRWHSGKVVLVGDSAHTAHFSIGSGTKLAMEDSIALARSLRDHSDLDEALDDYEMDRRPRVARFQEAAAQSRTYFERTGRYVHLDPVQFAFSLLTRSGRVDYNDLRTRDPFFVARVDRVVANRRGMAAVPPALAPLQLGGVELANRIVTESVAGADFQQSVGLAISGSVAVNAEGRTTADQACISEMGREQLREDRATGARAGLRIGHAGRRGACRPRERGSDRPLVEPWELLAPSPFAYTGRAPVPRAADGEDLVRVGEDFAAAARLAADAGIDVLIVDMARGYLLGSFLSPLTNHRADEYGRDFSGRTKWPLEVFTAVRARWPADRSLGVALSAVDWAPGGQTLEESIAFARMVRDRGCDFIEVRAGQTIWGDHPRLDPYYAAHYSDRIRNEAAVPTMATGNIASVDQINTIVGAGRADLCMLVEP